MTPGLLNFPPAIRDFPLYLPSFPVPWVTSGALRAPLEILAPAFSGTPPAFRSYLPWLVAGSPVIPKIASLAFGPAISVRVCASTAK